MAVRHGYGKVAGTDALVFAYDTGDTVNSYKGEPTENLITQMAGSTTISYPEVRYRCNEVEANVIDPSAPGGQYSRFTGQSLGNESNNQLYSRFNTANIDVRNQTVTYSVYLKGSGTCHLTIYADNAGYSTSSAITLTSTWTRYQYTTTPTNYTTNCWVAVRGILPTTDVYIAAQQAELKDHATQFTTGTRSVSGSLLDLTGLGGLNLSNVSFDSNAQMTFDGTNDKIELGSTFDVADHFTDNQSFTIEAIVKLYNTDTNFNGGIFSNQRYQTESDAPGFGLCIRYASNTLQYCMNIVEVDNSVQTSYESKILIPANIGNLEHVTYIYDNTTTTMYGYINGELIKSDTNATYNWSLPTNTTRTRIGTSTQGGWGYYHEMDLPVVKCYNRALTADEVRNNYRHYKNRFSI